MSISKLAVTKPVTILICFILAVALGIYCTANLPIDMYPDMDIPYIIVITKYGDTGPEEMEKAVSRLLEGSLSGVSGLKTLQSQSSTGVSLVILEFEYGINLDVAGNDVRDKIDMVRSNLPDECDAPIVMKLDPSMMPVMTLVVTGERKPDEIAQYVDDIVQPQLEQVDGVASAQMVGDREKAVLINVPKDRLAAYDLTLTAIAQMVGSQNITSSGGQIEQGDYKYTVSTEGDYSSIKDVKETVVTYRNTKNGKVVERVPIILRDIADVYQGYKDAESLAFKEYTPCVMLSVQKQSGKNSVAVASKIRKALTRINENLPHDVTIIETSNSTDEIENAIKEVVNSIVQGVALALIVLFIFLRNFKSTIVVGISMPVSLVITLLLMYFAGISLNMMSLSGLLLGIGMLVDNSIVILENIYSYQEKDTKAVVASELGSKEMTGAITSSTLTSVCIFLPMIMFNKKLGMMGKMFNAFAFAIVFSLMCSLLAALVLVPVLTSKYLKSENVHVRYKNPIMQGFDAIMQRFFTWLDHAYASKVSWVLDHKLLVAGTVAGLFVLAILSVGVIGFIYMPENASDVVQIDLEMPQGTKLAATQEIIQQMQSNVLDVVKGVKHTTVSVGSTSMIGGSADTNKASLIITLQKKKDRQPGDDDDASTKAKAIRFFKSFPDAQFTFGTGVGGQQSTGLEIKISSNDLDLCRENAAAIRNMLETDATDYVQEVTQDMKDGLPQLKIVLDRNRMAELGITSYAVGTEINAAIDGMVASRYDDNGDQIDIVVSFPDEDKMRFADIEQIYVANSMGQRIPVSSFAHYEEGLAPVTIYRENQRRMITITGKPVKGVSLGIINSVVHDMIQKNIIPDENVIISFGGDYEDMMESMQNFSAIILMAAALVFAVMAAQFESFKDPFIVLFTIPLSFIGVATIYFMVQTTFNMVTVIGMLMLVGTIVNNGIVLVDYTNMLRKRGMALREACVEAAGNRLRPILMSTLTTITSLIPMAFFPGEGGRMTQPIGLTELGGMSFGSLMTLFVMPTLYYVFNVKGEKKRVAIQEQNKKLADEARRQVEQSMAAYKAKGQNAMDIEEDTDSVEDYEEEEKKVVPPKAPKGSVKQPIPPSVQSSTPPIEEGTDSTNSIEEEPPKPKRRPISLIRAITKGNKVGTDSIKEGKEKEMPPKAHKRPMPPVQEDIEEDTEPTEEEDIAFSKVASPKVETPRVVSPKLHKRPVPVMTPVQATQEDIEEDTDSIEEEVVPPKARKGNIRPTMTPSEEEDYIAGDEAEAIARAARIDEDIPEVPYMGEGDSNLDSQEGDEEPIEGEGDDNTLDFDSQEPEEPTEEIEDDASLGEEESIEDETSSQDEEESPDEYEEEPEEPRDEYEEDSTPQEEITPKDVDYQDEDYVEEVVSPSRKEVITPVPHRARPMTASTKVAQGPRVVHSTPREDSDTKPTSRMVESANGRAPITHRAKVVGGDTSVKEAPPVKPQATKESKLDKLKSLIKGDKRLGGNHSGEEKGRDLKTAIGDEDL